MSYGLPWITRRTSWGKGIKTSRKKVREIAKVPAELCTEDETVSAGTFDLLAYMIEHIDPGPYDWDQVEVQLETYPTLNPYLEVDRTTMPVTRPTAGSVTIHGMRPDLKQAHFGIVDFYDQKEGQHNPELWWKDSEGKFGYCKNVKGHKGFDISSDIRQRWFGTTTTSRCL